MATLSGDPESQILTSSAEAESQLSSLVYDMSQQVQLGMENMLKTIAEIDQHCAGIVEEMGKCKNSELERKNILDEEKETFQKAAYTVLDMLNKGC